MRSNVSRRRRRRRSCDNGACSCSVGIGVGSKVSGGGRTSSGAYIIKYRYGGSWRTHFQLWYGCCIKQ